MSDTWQQVLLVALLWVLLAAGAPNPRRAALAGLLLGVAVMLRLVAISLVVPAVCYLIIAGGAWRSWRTWPGWRTVGARTLAFVAAFGVIIAGYGWYFHAQTGEWGLTRTTGQVLYGRTAVVADCDRLKLDRLTALACPKEPLGQRRRLDDYAHIQREAPFRERFPPHTDLYAVQRAFGWAVIDQQPLDVARAIGLDFLKGFRPTRTDAPGDTSVARWQFKPEYPPVDLNYSTAASRRVQRTGPDRRAVARRSFSVGTSSASATPPAPVGCVRRGRAAGRVRLGRARTSGIRSATLLAVGMAVTILLASAAFEFSWRYQLPGLVLLPFAGVLGITALLPGELPRHIRNPRAFMGFAMSCSAATLTCCLQWGCRERRGSRAEPSSWFTAVLAPVNFSRDTVDGDGTSERYHHGRSKAGQLRPQKGRQVLADHQGQAAATPAARTQQRQVTS